MRKLQVFFSSVQNEFADYRKELAEYIVSDKLLGQFFEPVLFENLSASDQRTDEVYLDLVSKCDIFLCLLGLQYGFENDKGISPTESEFMQAELANRNRIVFIQGNHEQRHPKMQKLVSLAESQLIRRRITNIVDLKTNVYSSFVQILMKRGYIQTAPFDSSIQRQTSMDDIDENRVRRFVALAQTKRGFPLSDQSTLTKLLTHLNLLRENQPTNAALLLFGRYPQSFFTSSIVKCAQFHGTEISKPIPAHRDFNGDIFELIDQAVDFVLSRIDISTGTRNESNDVPINYEIPRAVIVEAIVNAEIGRAHV